MEREFYDNYIRTSLHNRTPAMSPMETQIVAMLSVLRPFLRDEVRSVEVLPVLAYERIQKPIWNSFRFEPNEQLLVRCAFRWQLNGIIVPNAYEMFDVEVPLEILGMEIVESYGEHIHIVRDKI